MARAKYTPEFKLEAVRLVKAGQSIAAVAAILKIADGVLREGTSVKYAFIRGNRHWPASMMCELLDVSPSGYHADGVPSALRPV